MNDFLLEIEKYLDNEMSVEEKQAFEIKVGNDITLAEELKLQKDMRLVYNEEDWAEGNKEILKNSEAKQLKSFFKSDETAVLKTSINEVIAENRLSTSNRRPLFIGIAAAIAVLMTISLFVFKDSSTDKLYAQYIQVDDIPSLITRGEENDKLIENAQLLFEDKKYNEAITIFVKYQSEAESINPLSYIYTGIAYLEVDNFDKAIGQFNSLASSGTLQSKKADWYRAMVYLKQNNRELLLEALQSITADTSNFKYVEAKELIDLIE
ncbi:tol-pal system YbgF family protein [Aquimarina sp. AU474]|uniref:tetratricopeptide repeat protein n=1 Tax=Aquimarina sp. AU474 TaxID=2108529 RepID=UPI000D689A1B|nr:hypothetical protein [Aquimarina sp. AU474]